MRMKGWAWGNAWRERRKVGEKMFGKSDGRVRVA